MNINAIKNLVNSNLSEAVISENIYRIIAKEPDAITKVLKMIQYQQQRNENLILDVNVELTHIKRFLSEKEWHSSDKIRNSLITNINDLFNKYKDKFSK